MKRISKNPQPEALLKWKGGNHHNPANLIYKNVPREEIRQALLMEQHHLCAYTMKPLKTLQQCQASLTIATDTPTVHSCHIEHYMPQSVHADKAIDYQNMLACFPAAQRDKGQKNSECPYGAQKKADYDPEKNPFVSPLSANVEDHFAFKKNGEVQGVTEAGDATIKVLNLNHPILVNDRKEAIKGALYTKGALCSASELERIAVRVMQPDANHCLTPYCVAIAQVARKVAEQEKRRAQHMKKRS